MNTQTAGYIPAVRSAPRSERNETQLRHVADEVSRLEYGEIRIVVCGGNIVEVGATAKKRFSQKED